MLVFNLIKQLTVLEFRLRKKKEIQNQKKKDVVKYIFFEKA